MKCLARNNWRLVSWPSPLRESEKYVRIDQIRLMLLLEISDVLLFCFYTFQKIVVEMKTSRSVGKLTLVAFLEDVWWLLMPGVLQHILEWDFFQQVTVYYVNSSTNSHVRFLYQTHVPAGNVQKSLASRASHQGLFIVEAIKFFLSFLSAALCAFLTSSYLRRCKAVAFCVTYLEVLSPW